MLGALGSNAKAFTRPVLWYPWPSVPTVPAGPTEIHGGLASPRPVATEPKIETQSKLAAILEWFVILFCMAPLLPNRDTAILCFEPDVLAQNKWHRRSRFMISPCVDSNYFTVHSGVVGGSHRAVLAWDGDG